MDTSLIFSIVSALIALIALFFTGKQISLSNKHQLFDRRIEKYKIIKDLLSTYESTRNALLKDKSIELSCDVYLGALFSVPCMKDLLSVVDEPLDSKNRKKFFDKCTWLSKTSMEVQIIFQGKPAEIMSEFCVDYFKLLQIMYFEYSKNVYELDRSISEQLGEMSDYQEIHFFPTDETIKGSINRIEKVYKTIIDDNIENKLVKQIKL